MKIRWCHFSDIHFAFENYQTIQMRKSLIDYLNKIVNNSGKLDFILISGDITNQYGVYSDELSIFINNIATIAGVDISNVEIIPGNHDIERNSDRSKLIEEYLGNDNIENANNISEMQLRAFLKYQNKFFDFYYIFKNKPFHVNDIHKNKTFTFADRKINLIRLNTTWLSEEDDKNKLNIGMQFLGKTTKNIDTHDINLMLSHHPISWFSDIQQKQLKTFLFENSIDMFLSGHIHKSYVETIDDTIYCSCIQNKVDDITGGFVIAEINMETNQNKFEFHSWNSNQSFWSFDNDVCIRANNGLYEFRLDKLPKDDNEKLVVLHDLMQPSNPNSVRTIFDFANSEIFNINHIINSINDWENKKEKNLDFFEEIIKFYNNREIHIFPLSEIPLLIHFGYLFQDNYPIKIHQYDRNSAHWIIDEEDTIPKLNKPNVIKNDNTDLAIIISLSAKINNEDIKAILEDYDEIDISLENPELNSILYRNQVKYIKNIFDNTVQEYLSANHNCNNIHIFYSGPAGLAVELGRIIRKNMFPIVSLYQYQRNSSPKYSFTFTIND